MREIIALVVLIALIVGVVAFMAWYLHIGHNWNAAANVIDDMVGSMDRYSVVVYEGTKLIPSDETETPSDKKASSEARPAASGEDDDVQGKEAAEDGAVTLERVTSSYRDKGATVIEIHLDDISRYEDPVIVSKNGERIGIITASNPLSSVKVRVAAKELREDYDVDTVIAILESREDVRDGLSNVDIAVCLEGGELPEGGIDVGETFAVGVPSVGEVQAVIIPKSGVLTSKTITSL